MDFHSIINAAKQNVSEADYRNNKYYKTKFEAPKKTIKEKKLSHGIKKFLEKQQQEEEEKLRREREKKMELLARRDPKEQRKIEKTLKVIKSSKKYYTGDKELDENTEVTLQNTIGDNDDYDFESKYSESLYEKLMEKYKQMPTEDKFSSFTKKTKPAAASQTNGDNGEIHIKNGHRQRVSTIKSEHAPSTSKKSSQPSAIQQSSNSDKDTNKKSPMDKPKPKHRPAPPVNFEQLLKLAEQKQHEDIVIDVPSHKKEPERLMTSKEKREMEEIEAARKAKLKGNGAIPKIPKLGAIPRLGDSSKQDKNNNSDRDSKMPQKTSDRPKLNSTSSSRNSNNSPLPSGSKLRDALVSSKSEKSLTNGSSSSKNINPQRPPQVPQASSKQPLNGSSIKSKDPFAKPSSSKMPPPMKNNSSSSSSSINANKSDKSKLAAKTSKEPLKTRDFPPKDLMRTREFPPKDLMRSREFPPRDLMRTREFPPRDLKRPMKQPKMNLKRRVIEDEDDSEYDSELDDFIDDDEEDFNYSSEIQKMFGYDKSRYRDEDFDDREMESDWRTVMKEEAYSKRMGIQEDLEDMRMEEEERKRKELMKKKRRKL